MGYLDKFEEKRAACNMQDDGAVHDLIDHAHNLLSEADGEIADHEQEVDDLRDDVREAERDAEDSRTELERLEDSSLQLCDTSNGIAHGVRMSMEVALAHAQATFGFHAKETHFIEGIIEQL